MSDIARLEEAALLSVLAYHTRSARESETVLNSV